MGQLIRSVREGKIPLYEKDARYSHIYDEDQIRIPEENARVHFRFRRSAEGTDYWLTLTQDEIPVKLNIRNLKVVMNYPCVMLLNNRLLVCDEVDVKKIQPFFTREVIHVKPEMEQVYYQNFVEHMIRDHPVEVEGIRLVTSLELPVPVLTLEPDLSFIPVFVLRFRYGHVECLPGDSRK